MAVTRMVVGTPAGNGSVTIPAGTFTSDEIIAGTPTNTAYGSPANFGTGSWSGVSSAWAEGFPVTVRDNEVMYLDSAGGATTGPARLYQALAAAGCTFRAFVQGQDDVGHAALGN